jgi:hypothetical protein
MHEFKKSVDDSQSNHLIKWLRLAAESGESLITLPKKSENDRLLGAFFGARAKGEATGQKPTRGEGEPFNSKRRSFS